MLLGFTFWQMELLQTRQIDRFILREGRLMAGQPPQKVLHAVDLDPNSRLHRRTIAALFDANGGYLAGNLAHLPAALPIDGVPHRITVAENATQATLRAMAFPLPDGRIVIIGRSTDALLLLRHVVWRTLIGGLIPAVLLSMAVGLFLSRRTLRRLGMLHRAIDRIMRGDLHERLPVQSCKDELGDLILSVNAMLGTVDRLVTQLRQAGDNIAHDLRTPLARMRVRLESACTAGLQGGAMQTMVEKTIADLDRLLAIVSALLRIGDIESNRQGLLTDIPVGEILPEIAELYQPVAEEKQIALRAQPERAATVRADRELLTELLANLVDNAIKFTPSGGVVTLGARSTDDALILFVADDGPGVPPEDGEKIFARFYRADKSRQIAGNGLGLSIAKAIADLHGFRLRVRNTDPGCVFELLIKTEAR
jgi:hypothetical protein